MDTEEAAAFWSYTHKDNAGEGDRVVKLAHDVQDQYGMLTGGELVLFLDRDKIEWGDNLRQRIDQALAGTTFFIPIITPRYFASEECRRELIAFAQETKKLKVEALLLPVHYVDVPDLTSKDEPTDAAMKLVRECKWEDWRTLSLEDSTSSVYRQGVRRLAERLVGVVRSLTQEPVSPAGGSVAVAVSGVRDARSTVVEAVDDDSPGLIELIADGEEAFPEWNRIITETSPEIDAIGNLAAKAAEEIKESDARGGGGSGRLKVAIRLAERMKPHSDSIHRLGQEGAAALMRVAPAIDALLDEISRTPTENLDMDQVREFGTAIRGLASSGKTAVQSIREMSASFDQSARASRALRPPIRDMQNGLRGFTDAQAIFESWQARLDEIEGIHGSGGPS
jgi:TIR domain